MKSKKMFLSYVDDKIYIPKMNMILLLGYKTYLYRKKLSEQQIKIAFWSSYKSIILIFSLGQIAFSSSYENIILIFSLMRIAFFSSYKNIILFLGLTRIAFFWVMKILFTFKSLEGSFLYIFWFSIYKMVDMEHNPDSYRSLEINVGSKIKLQIC